MDAAQILSVVYLLGVSFVCDTQHAQHTQAPHTQAPHTQAPHTQQPNLTQALYTQAPDPNQISPCYNCQGTHAEVVACLQTQPITHCPSGQECEVLRYPNDHENHIRCTSCTPHPCVVNPDGSISHPCHECCHDLSCVMHALGLLPPLSTPVPTTHLPENTQAPATTQAPVGTQTPPATTQSPVGTQTQPETTQSWTAQCYDCQGPYTAVLQCLNQSFIYCPSNTVCRIDRSPGNVETRLACVPSNECEVGTGCQHDGDSVVSQCHECCHEVFCLRRAIQAIQGLLPHSG